VDRFEEFVQVDVDFEQAVALCAWLRRTEEDEGLAAVLWQDDSEKVVLRDVRVDLERGMAGTTDDPRLEMTRARALVLGDWLWRMEQSQTLVPLFGEVGSAPQRALWSLETWLDLTLFSEFSDSGYFALVRAARERVLTDHLRAN